MKPSHIHAGLPSHSASKISIFKPRHVTSAFDIAIIRIARGARFAALQQLGQAGLFVNRRYIVRLRHPDAWNRAPRLPLHTDGSFL
jgi:hypothetical protein